MKKRNKVILIILSLIAVVVIVLMKFGYDLRQTLYFSNYSEHNSSYLNDFYANKNVVFFVPHEDDDYNLAGGILEQYVNAGSSVHVVYVTNGDAYGGGDRRIQESAVAMARLGLLADNLIFLGYGDDWNSEEYNHIYYAPGDEVLTSMGGYNSTYAGSGFTDFHTMLYGESAPYTRNNIKGDISDVILGYMPDVIYCIECDEHPDHKMVSLLFEECMGQILRDNEGYEPKVYKGFGYCTGWDGARDYYDDNVLSVAYETDDGTMKLRPNLMWSERLRFPVAASTLAFTEHASSSYTVLDAFKSQDALHNFVCLVNSDKVFWERRTDSLLYNASIAAPNLEEACFVNDFKLSDSDNIRKDVNKIRWNRGICHLKSGDSIKVSLDVPTDMDSIVLYDSAEKENDIINGTIRFDDGTVIELPNIVNTGAATEVNFKKKKVSSFEFIAGDTCGDNPGIMELEAFDSSRRRENYSFVKLMANNNFMYDYHARRGDRLNLAVYSYPVDNKTTILIDGEEINGGEYVYDGRMHVVSALSENGDYDEAILYNLTWYKELLVKIARIVEKVR